MTTATAPTPPPPSKPRRWGRRLLWGLLGLVGLVLLLVVGALAYLMSPPGEARLRDFAVAQANEQLMGHLEVGGLALSPRSVMLTGVTLDDPEGERVVELGRLEVRFALLPLLGQHVRVRSVVLGEPHLTLRQDARGLNLSRAVAMKNPSPPEPEDPNAPRGKLRFTLESLRLEGGQVSLVTVSPEGNQEVRLETLDATGAASWAAATEALAAKLDATAALDKPQRGPVRLAVSAQGEEGALSGDVDFTAPGLVLQASGGMEGEKQLHAEVKRLTLEPTLGRAVLPSYPLAAPVSLAGTVGMTGDVVKVDLNAQAADGTLTAQGAVDLEKFTTDGFTARLRGLDLAKLLGGGPAATLAADLSVKGGGKSLDTLDGQLDFSMPASPIAGQQLGPVEMHVNAKQGRFTLARLQALAPGVTLTADGVATQQDVNLKGQLLADNLGTFAGTVGRLGGGEPLPLSGKGALSFNVSGPLQAPAVSLVGGFDTVAWADTAVKALTVDVRMPDVTQPLITDARIRARELSAGGRDYQNLAATLATQGRKLDLSLTTEGQENLTLALAGLVDKDNQGLTLDDLTLRYPEEGWTLKSPTHVAWGKAVEIKPALTLTSGEQLLSLGLRMEGTRLQAHTELRAFDLSRLPKAFLPPDFDVEGLLSGTVAVSGTTARPDARAQMTLRGGRYQQYDDLAFEVDARYVGDKAKGTFSASAPAFRVSSRFDVPVQALLKQRREAVDLLVTVDHLDLGPTLRMAQQPETVTGQVTGTLTLKGMANDPRLQLTLKGSELRYWGATATEAAPVIIAPGALPADMLGKPLAFELTAQSDEKDGALSASLHLDGLAEKATASLATPFTLGRLIAKTPTSTQMMNTPMRAIDAEISELPLTLLAQFGFATEAGGTLSMKTHLTGPVLSPVGELTLTAKRATVNGVVPIDGDLALTTSASAVKVKLVAKRDATLLAQLEAQVNASLEALQDQDVVGRVPFTLSAKAGPISQRELEGLASVSPKAGALARCRAGERVFAQPSDSGTPQNVIALTLRARGTLEDPQVDLTAGLQNIGVDQMGLGHASVHYTYADAKSAFEALLTSPTGGTLMARGSAKQDLSLSTLRKGMDPNRIPIEVQLDSHQFDLGFLSGSQLPMVRTLGGELIMEKFRVDGTVGSPVIKGRVEWNKGRLALEGLGDYRDVHVALRVDDQRMELTDFSAKSGGGSLQLKARGDRTPSGAYVLSGEGQMDDFPLVLDDQLFAILQLRTQFEGDISKSTQFVNVKNLSIPELHVKLPDAKRKDLQPLERPEGIVLTCAGEPLNPPKTASAEASADGATPGSATGGAGPSSATRRIRVTLNAPRNLWVQGADVNVELGLSENFYVETADTLTMNGNVLVKRGDVEVLGRRFSVQNSSQVRFTGPPAAPYINATAEYKNESAGVTVYVAVRGQGKDFTIKPTSDPPLAETDIYTLLATGRRTLKAGGSGASMNQGQVASVLGSVLAAQAKKAISAKVPLDVLSIESGDEGLAGARLEVGKYLTDKLYLGYSGRIGTPQNQSTTRRENANSVRLEYQFGPRWGVEAQYGDAQVGGADLLWSNEY
ncbi:translocation/assembly module TamB [Archangium primigenium]|uniref:translocation/assembly module TamB n=1 Tax=[Archangium] primigenium TaxID=2792470 RepID=UPI00195C1DBA|nr:translocation/assembly module TamB [Archangium primigenium]MBM7113491.1 translocation/assembly module TamB domain-containing protein [Archangium primigenium]